MSASFWWVNHSHTYRAEIEGSYTGLFLRGVLAEPAAAAA